VDLKDIVAQTEAAVGGQLFKYGCFKEVPSKTLQAEMNKALEESGSAMRYRNLLGITLGTGLGAGIVIDGRPLDVRASIGIALIDRHADPEALMRNADTAMYTAKAQGKHRVVVFEPEMYETNVQRFNLRSELQRAVERDEFVVHYQPIVTIDGQQLLSVEALIRWQHPTLGILTPESFLAVAVDTGLIVEIDRLVLDRTCSWLAELDVTHPLLVPRAAVNLSPRSFAEPDLADRILDTLAKHGLSTERLTIEITEDLMSEHASRAGTVLARLSSAGIRLALDDFGTGYSSLSHLSTLPVEVVKIPKPFIDGLDGSSSQRAFAAAIIALSKALELAVVAEGVERPEQLAVLKSLGCDAGQGYLFARPVDGQALVAWAIANRGRPSYDNLVSIDAHRTRAAVAASRRI